MSRHDDWWRTQAKPEDLTDKNLELDVCLELIAPDIEPAISVGSSVFELGSGIGRLTIPLAKRFKDANFIGCEINQDFREQAIAGANRAGVAERCYFMDTIDTKLRADAAYSMLVLQHMTNPTKQLYIKQISQMLNKGGIFRFQYVEGVADTFLTHDAKFVDVANWLRDAGLEVASVDYNLIEPRWTWVTAVKE